MTPQFPKDDDGIAVWLDSIDPDPTDARDARHMRRIIAAAEKLDVAQAELNEAVAVAREAGDSWAMIGTALGINRRAAQQRFDETD
jgi:hypothetical protein